jgi:outer membrane protein
VARNNPFTVICAMLLAAAAASAGEDAKYAVTTAPGQQERGVSFGAPELRLTMQQAVTLALEHNINLEVSRLSLARSGQGSFAASGIFDPVFSADGSNAYSSSPSTNQLQGATVSESRRRTFDLALSTLLPIGTQTSLSWTNARTTTNSSFYYLNPNYATGLGLQLVQPLLRGFGTDVNRNGIEVARKSHDISRLQFEQIVISTVQQVESAYWDMVYARENLKVKQQSLQLARDLLGQTQTRVRIGTSAPIDIVQSEATVAAREQDIILAAHAVDEASDVLKGLMGFETLEDWASLVTPVEDLTVNRAPVDLSAAVATALERRPDLKQDEIQKAVQQMNLIVAENQVRPQLNLSVGYGLSGVGGTLTVQDPNTGQIVTVPGGWDDALHMLRDAKYDQWSTAVNLSYPLGNNQAKAQRAQARFDLHSAEQTLAAQRQTVIQDVRRAVRAIEDSGKSIDASAKARVLAERNLDAEQKKFANGMSTNYQVLQIQSDLEAAQVTELASRVAFKKSMLGYGVSTGTLLDTVGVSLQEDEAKKEPHNLWKDVGWMKFGHWISTEETPSEVTQAPPAEKPKEPTQ